MTESDMLAIVHEGEEGVYERDKAFSAQQR